MKKNAITFILLLLTSGIAMAADDLKSTVEAGYLKTTGNTQTTAMSGKATLDHTAGNFRNALKIAVIYVKGEEGKQAERYFGEGSTSYQFNTKLYGFLNANLDRDSFSGYDYQSVLSAGLGYLFVNSEIMFFNIEGGPGVRFNKLDVNNASTDSETVARINGKFVYKFSEKSDFTQEITSDIGSDSAITNSLTSLTAKIAGDLAMKVSYIIKHNTEAPEGIEKTDTITALTLLYTFEK